MRDIFDVLRLVGGTRIYFSNESSSRY